MCIVYKNSVNIYLTKNYNTVEIVSLIVIVCNWIIDILL